jgi:hypothetical protein
MCPKTQATTAFQRGSKKYGTLGVTLDTWLTWSAHVNQVRKKAAQILSFLSPLLNRSALSIRNGVLFYKQLIRPMMDYACLIWRSAVHTLTN